MPLYLVLNESEQRGAWCRVCRSRVKGTEEHVGRHMARCAQKHYEAQKPQRDQLAFLKPEDVEYAEWLPRAYRQGKIKPSTERF